MGQHDRDRFSPAPALPLHLDLIGGELRSRLVDRILRDTEFQHRFGHEDELTQRSWGQRVVDQTLGFLQLCASSEMESYSPSHLVDIGWHIFILHTREYAAFCARVAGRFIHHEPAAEGVDPYRGVAEIGRTVAAMRVRGLAVDEALWPTSVTTGVHAPKCHNKGCASGCGSAMD